MALLNTYGPSDDTWTVPLPAGYVIIDARASGLPYTPSGSVGVGLGHGIELGISGVPLDPYFKLQLPSLGRVTPGLVLGAQLTGNLVSACESTLSVTLPGGLFLDLGLGIGYDATMGQSVFHSNMTLDIPVPTTNGVVTAEVFGQTGSLGQRVVYQQALTPMLSFDVSGFMLEPGGPGVMLGVSSTLPLFMGDTHATSFQNSELGQGGTLTPPRLRGRF